MRNFVHHGVVVIVPCVVAAILVACSAPEPAAPPPARPAPPVARPQPAAPDLQNQKTSEARTPRDYRKDAASHLYALNKSRIYQGKMPPLLHAVGVLQVDIDGRGQVTNVSWMRAPRHAPDVMAEIERSVRKAAPFPAPVRMGKVTYTDTWLWHSSGRFQLDTLTEGQL
jgi:periplasmic protein TonB